MEFNTINGCKMLGEHLCQALYRWKVELEKD
jgi:hypothetical protein